MSKAKPKSTKSVNPDIHPIIFKDVPLRKIIGTLLAFHKTSTIVLKATISVSSADASTYTAEITVQRRKKNTKV